VQGDTGDGRPTPRPTFDAVSLPPLRTIAERRGFEVGLGVRHQFLGNPTVAGMLSRNVTSITEQNAFKWLPTEPFEGRFYFRLTDWLVNFAGSHHLRLRGSTLVWWRQNPSWLLDQRWTPAALRQVMRRHIETVMGRYRGQISQWDVVNEPFVDNPVRLRSDVFSRTLGPSYIDDAFRWAHAADPSAELFLNDFGNDTPSPHFWAEYRLLKGMIARGVPVDGVGLQMHHTLTNVPSPRQLIRVIRAFAGLGLKVEITEMEMALPLPPTAADFTRQAIVYRSVTAACMAVPACTGLTVWGGDDSDPSDIYASRGLGDGTLYDRSGRRKQAYNGVAQGLAFTPGRPNRLPFPTPSP